MNYFYHILGACKEEMPEEGEGALVKTSADGTTINPGGDWTPAGKNNSDLTVVFPLAVEITSLQMTDKIAPFEFLASFLPENKQEYVSYKDGEGKSEVRCNLSNEYKIVNSYQLLARSLVDIFRHSTTDFI